MVLSSRAILYNRRTNPAEPHAFFDNQLQVNTLNIF